MRTNGLQKLVLHVSFYSMLYIISNQCSVILIVDSRLHDHGTWSWHNYQIKTGDHQVVYLLSFAGKDAFIGLGQSGMLDYTRTRSDPWMSSFDYWIGKSEIVFSACEQPILQPPPSWCSGGYLRFFLWCGSQLPSFTFDDH